MRFLLASQPKLFGQFTIDNRTPAWFLLPGRKLIVRDFEIRHHFENFVGVGCKLSEEFSGLLVLVQTAKPLGRRPPQPRPGYGGAFFPG